MMNYFRKLVGGAIVGATVSTIVSLNRDSLYRLFHSPQRQKLIEELKLWHEADLRDYKTYADAETTQYMAEKADHFAALLANEKHSNTVITAYLVELEQRARKVMYLELKARAEVIYGDRLFELDRKLAQAQYDTASRDLAKAGATIASLRDDKFPIDGLLKRVYVRYLIH
jgi:hypothetical protein